MTSMRMATDRSSRRPRAQRRQPRRLELIAVEQVERVERDQPPVRMCDVDARLLDRAEIERLRVDELHDQQAEDVRVTDVALHARQAAEQVLEPLRLLVGAERGGEELDERPLH